MFLCILDERISSMVKVQLSHDIKMCVKWTYRAKDS
jgi:hypothetical protein